MFYLFINNYYIIFYTNYYIMRIFDLPSSEEDAIKLFQQYNIIPTMRKCDNDHQMKLSTKLYRWLTVK